MKITEDKIRQAIEYFAKNDKPEFSDIPNSHIEIFNTLKSYLSSDSFSFLGLEEKVYLEYVFLVLWKAGTLSHITVQEFNINDLFEQEEQNWNRFHNSRSKDFRESLTPFFQNYAEEDALAFIEDCLIDAEEEEFLSPIGREFIFIGLKSIVDLITGNPPE